MKDSYILIAQYYGISIISKLIKWRTWSDVSHTAALSQNGAFVYEAWKAGVTKTPWNTQNHTPGTKVIVYKVPCTKFQADVFYKFLENEIGQKYDFLALVGFVLRLPIEGIQEKFCSQLIFEACKAAGINLLARIDSYKVSPGHIDISPSLEFYDRRETPGAV